MNLVETDHWKLYLNYTLLAAGDRVELKVCFVLFLFFYFMWLCGLKLCPYEVSGNKSLEIVFELYLVSCWG